MFELLPDDVALDDRLIAIASGDAFVLVARHRETLAILGELHAVGDGHDAAPPAASVVA